MRRDSASGTPSGDLAMLDRNPMSIDLSQPHHAIWPARLPRELVLPETSLWFNTEVVAKRYPDKAAYVFCGRPLTFAAIG
jgi:hypothetical protein